MSFVGLSLLSRFIMLLIRLLLTAFILAVLSLGAKMNAVSLIKALTHVGKASLLQGELIDLFVEFCKLRLVVGGWHVANAINVEPGYKVINKQMGMIVFKIFEINVLRKGALLSYN